MGYGYIFLPTGGGFRYKMVSETGIYDHYASLITGKGHLNKPCSKLR